MTAKKRIGAKELGIDLSAPADADVFRWLIACQLFGARIRQEIAARAFAELDQARILTPGKLAGADWQQLVDLLGAGGYRRYDETTARALISNGQRTMDEYDGQISRIRDGVSSKTALRRRVQQFTGVGPTAADIFVREIAPAWNL